MQVGVLWAPRGYGEAGAAARFGAAMAALGDIDRSDPTHVYASEV